MKKSDAKLRIALRDTKNITVEYALIQIAIIWRLNVAKEKHYTMEQNMMLQSAYRRLALDRALKAVLAQEFILQTVSKMHVKLQKGGETQLEFWSADLMTITILLMKECMGRG